MSIGRDSGTKHRMALSRLATSAECLSGPNHTVPVLKEIIHGDMIFAVFPLMSTGFGKPWYYYFSEVLDAVEQVLEVLAKILYLLIHFDVIRPQGINFCHDQLVAHLV